MLKFLYFFLNFLSVHFHCVKLAVVSCLYIYPVWLCTFFLGCLSAVLYIQFFAQFDLPFVPIIFDEVDAWLGFFLFAVFLFTFFISFLMDYCIQVVFNISLLM